MTQPYVENPTSNNIVDEGTIDHIMSYIRIGANNYARDKNERGDIAADRILPIFIKDLKKLNDEPHESFQKIYDLLKIHMDNPNENVSCFGFVMATKLYSLRGRLLPDEPPEGYLLDLLHMFEKTAYNPKENDLLRDAASNALVSVERKRHERDLNQWHLDPKWIILYKNILNGEKYRDSKPIKTSGLNTYNEKNSKYISKQIKELSTPELISQSLAEWYFRLRVQIHKTTK